MNKKIIMIATFSKVFELSEEEIPKDQEALNEYVDCDPFAWIDDERTKLVGVDMVDLDKELNELSERKEKKDEEI